MSIRLPDTHRHECNDASDHPQTRGSRPHRSEGNHPQTRGSRASQKRGGVTHRRGEEEDTYHRSGVGSCTHRSGGRHHRSGVGSADWMHRRDLSQAGYIYMRDERCRLSDGEKGREGRRQQRRGKEKRDTHRSEREEEGSTHRREGEERRGKEGAGRGKLQDITPSPSLIVTRRADDLISYRCLQGHGHRSA